MGAAESASFTSLQTGAENKPANGERGIEKDIKGGDLKAKVQVAWKDPDGQAQIISAQSSKIPAQANKLSTNDSGEASISQ